MESTDNDFKATHVIGKLHNMQWLKSNSQLSGHIKTYSDSKEAIVKRQFDEETNHNAKVPLVGDDSDLQLEDNDFFRSKSLDNVNSIINSDTLESNVNIGNPERDMETVWNKDVNVSNSLFPNSQSLDEQNTMSSDLPENIDAQLEQLKLSKGDKKFNESHSNDESDWNSIHNTMDSQKSDADPASSKQCHDNNNNNAKSKAQPAPEARKSLYKSTAKIGAKKVDQNTRRQSGNLKESCIIPKQGFKDRDDLLDPNKSTAESKKLSGVNARFSDKAGKVTGCKLSTGKERQAKEQQFHKQHFPTVNGCSRNSAEVLDEKSKLKHPLKTPRNDSDKRSSEAEDTKKCHKVQVNRVQSYNVQYIRSKPNVKSQQRYPRIANKEEENFVKHAPGFSNDNLSNENTLKKKCEDQATVNKQISDKQLGKNSRDSEYGMKSSSAPCKKSFQNLSNAKIGDREDQGHSQKFRRDTNTYRRSVGSVQTFSKDVNGKTRTDEHKRNSVDGKTRPESSRVTVYSHKEVNGASNAKTDTSDSSVNNVQSQGCSTGTKDSIDAMQEPLQAACGATEVQLTKTEQEDASINHSNNKSINNSETKSVKFSDNVQEIMRHSAVVYNENPVNKFSMNPFYSSLQSPSSDAQQIENYQSVQTKNYFGQNNAQYTNVSANAQNSERDLYLMDIAQKPEPHVSLQSASPHNCNSVIAMSPYQNMPAMYLNQFSNVQGVPRKTADTIVSHTTLAPSTPSYTMESQNMMQTEPNSIYMHNTQTSILPPPGFHNHSVTTQPSQWNLPVPDMYMFGNVMNSPHSLNVMPNSRQLCGTEYNNMQQGYLQHPLFYVPQLCNWNPLLQYPALLFQNQYTNCSTFQGMPPNSLADTANTSAQSNAYKMQMESNASYQAPLKLDYAVKSNNRKDNARPNQYRNSVSNEYRNPVSNEYRNPVSHEYRNPVSTEYRNPLSNEYQNCAQDPQVVPFSYAMESIARNISSTMQVQMNQKFPPRALNYQMQEACVFQSNQERQEDSKDAECIPPMVSPRDCMYYGVNYPRKDNIQNSMRPAKPMGYTHYAQKHVTYQAPKEFAKGTIGRGNRHAMDQ